MRAYSSSRPAGMSKWIFRKALVYLSKTAGTLREIGRLEEASTAYEEAAAIFRETGDHHNGSVALGNLDKARTRRRGGLMARGRRVR